MISDEPSSTTHTPSLLRRGSVPTASVKYWLADTGCGYDLVAKKHVAKFTDKTKQSDNPIMFNTANGNTYATTDILLRVEELDEDVEPYVLDSTPAVLSVGRRCVDFGYAFHWPPGSHKPYFVTPKGKRIELVVQDYVPYVKTKLAKHTAMTVISKTETPGIIAVNHAEQLPRASQVALAGHDVARSAGRQAKANHPSATAGHESALFEGGPVVAVPPDGPDPAVIDLEGDEPEMIVPVDETTRERLRREAKSLLHLRDHKPKNPYCDACQQSKMFRRPHGRLKHHGPLPTKFGESLSADHLVSHSEKSQSLLGDKNAVVIFDRYSSWKGVYPVPSKSGNDAFTALQHFVGARTKVTNIYTDNSPELAAAIKHLGWCHTTNTPGISQTNSTIELQVQDILHGSRTLLVQAGLPACFWNYSAPHYCFGTNITQHGDRKSAYELRFPQEGKFQHEFYPFGCLVHFMQTKTLKDDDRPAKFAPTGATGILLGYKLHPGGKWRHEYIVADVREFDAVDFRATSDPKTSTQSARTDRPRDPLARR